MFDKTVEILFSGGSIVISNFADIEKFRLRCGPAHGVMLCQAAMWNPSIFRAEGLLPLSEVAKRFLELVNRSFDSLKISKRMFNQLFRVSNLTMDFQI